MADPRQGRAGQSGFSPRLAKSGRGDPRLRSNQAGAVADADLRPGSIARDGSGRTRFSGFDSIPPLPASATLADVIARANLMLARGKGQA